MVVFRCYAGVTSMLIKHLLVSALLVLGLSAYAQREMGIGVPKHIPIKINVKNLNNENWANDFEVEITNKSDKPIYYLSLLVVPQGESETTAFWLHYGRPQLNNFSTPLESTDVPLLPDETCVLKIPEASANGWETFRVYLESRNRVLHFADPVLHSQKPLCIRKILSCISPISSCKSQNLFAIAKSCFASRESRLANLQNLLAIAKS